MSEIDELQRRIMAAMERIGNGVGALAAHPVTPPEPAGQGAAPADVSALQAALDEEKLANAQLEERLRALKARHADELAALTPDSGADDDLAALREQMEAQKQAMARLDTDLQRLRLANEQLRQSNDTLRQANETGVAEPHLINKAMLAELEGLRAVRATDLAEANAVLAKLEPLLAGARNLPQGEEM